MNSSITFIYDYKRGYPAIDIVTTLVQSVKLHVHVRNLLVVDEAEVLYVHCYSWFNSRGSR